MAMGSESGEEVRACICEAESFRTCSPLPLRLLPPLLDGARGFLSTSSERIDDDLARVGVIGVSDTAGEPGTVLLADD